MSANELSFERLLRAHAPRAPEQLRARVLALEPAPVPRWTLPSRRLALVALPAACVIAVGAALVHGALRSGGGAVATRSLPPAATAKDAFATATPAAAGGVAQQTTPSVTSSSRLAHTDASLQIRVRDADALSAATTRATRIATSLGGYAKSVDYRTPQNGDGAAYIELRVPASAVKVAIARLAGLGTVVSQQLSVADLQDRVRTETAQIGQLRRRVAALQAALRDASLPDAQRVLLRIRLAESKRALAQRLHARAGTVAAGATASISLVIGTQKAIAPVAHQGRLGRMLHSAVGFLALEGVVLLYVLIVVSPLALLAWLFWFWRRRSVDRLLAA